MNENELKEKLIDNVWRWFQKNEMIDKFGDVLLRRDVKDLQLLIDEIFKYLNKELILPEKIYGYTLPELKKIIDFAKSKNFKLKC